MGPPPSRRLFLTVPRVFIHSSFLTNEDTHCSCVFCCPSILHQEKQAGTELSWPITTRRETGTVCRSSRLVAVTMTTGQTQRCMQTLEILLVFLLQLFLNPSVPLTAFAWSSFAHHPGFLSFNCTFDLLSSLLHSDALVLSLRM